MRKAFVVLMILAVTTGCAGWGKWASDNDSSSQSGSSTGPSLNQAFYAFPDIAIPQELTYQRDKSFIYETPTLRAGVMRFSGNLDMASLETYFRTNMAKNGWNFVNSFKTTDIALNFVKDQRSSNIRIAPGTFTTHVEIWVGPTDRGSTGFERGAMPVDRGPGAMDKGSSIKEEPIGPSRRP